MVEVDASDLGVGAVLSQRAPKDNCIHPCTFFSLCFSSAEQKCVISEWELLEVKLALEEWHPWLEGAEQPFNI